MKKQSASSPGWVLTGMTALKPPSAFWTAGRSSPPVPVKVVTELVREAMVSGQGHLFLFTKPGNVEKFRGVAFYPVCETNEAALLENRRDGITRFVAGLENPAAVGTIGAIVANCNPFTNGHRYLVEHAAAQCALVHLFILSENKSRFSTVDRLELARRGVADLNNVVHPTSDYLISSATFPDYFLKDKVRAKEINCRLDLQIFAERFAAPLGITVRFVGTEPTYRVTSTYNQQMKTVRPPLGVEVVEVPRPELEGASQRQPCPQAVGSGTCGAVRQPGSPVHLRVSIIIVIPDKGGATVESNNLFARETPITLEQVLTSKEERAVLPHTLLTLRPTPGQLHSQSSRGIQGLSAGVEGIFRGKQPDCCGAEGTELGHSISNRKEQCGRL